MTNSTIKKFTSEMGQKMWFFFFALSVGISATLFFVFFARAAATYTVCANACDFTKIADAVTTTTLASGDTIQVFNTYDASLDDPTYSLPAGVALNCIPGTQVGTAAATTTLTITSDSLVQDCTFLRSDIAITGSNNDLIVNTFTTSSPSTITLTNTNDVSFLANDGDFSITLLGTNTLTQVDQNDFITNDFSRIINTDGSISLAVTDNTFTISDYFGEGMLLENSGSTVFSSNIIKFTTTTPTVSVAGSPTSAFLTTISPSTTLSYNYFEIPFIVTDSYTIQSFAAGSFSNTTNILHNTVYQKYANKAFIRVHSTEAVTPGLTIDANVMYNMLYISNSDALASGQSAIHLHNAASADFEAQVDYNGINGFGSIATTSSVSATIGTHNQTGDPHVYYETSIGQYRPAPISSYLDVNASEDIGSYEATRRSTIYIDSESPTVDYITVDATSTPRIFNTSTLRTGDTVQLANGYYTFPTISTSTFLQGYITINGVGSGTSSASATIFRQCSSATGMGMSYLNNITISNVTFEELCGTTDSAFTLTQSNNGTILENILFYSSEVSAPRSGLNLINVTSSTLNDVRFQDIHPTFSDTYFLADSLFSVGATDYISGPAFNQPDSTFFLYQNSGCDIISHSEAADVTDYISASNWHVALAQVAGIRLTMWVPGQLISSEGQLESDCSNMGEGFGALNVEHWIPNVLVESGGSFTYNAAAVSSAGATVNPDFDTPAMTIRPGINGGGIKFTNSSNNTVTSATSTNVSCGVYFTGTSENNTFSNFSIVDSEYYNICSNATTGYNSIREPNFSTTSSTIQGAGTVHIQYKARAYVTLDGNPFSGAAIIFQNALGTASTTVTSDVTGYTPYTSYLSSIILNSSSVSNSAGGMNPYSLSLDSALYAATSSVTIASVDETFPLTMVSDTVTIPQGVTATANSATQITVSWTGDAAEYYVEEIDTHENSGWITDTSYAFTPLTCATSYSFHVKARSAFGTESPYSSPTFQTQIIESSFVPLSISMAYDTSTEQFGLLYLEDQLDIQRIHFSSSVNGATWTNEAEIRTGSAGSANRDGNLVRLSPLHSGGFAYIHPSLNYGSLSKTFASSTYGTSWTTSTPVGLGESFYTPSELYSSASGFMYAAADPNYSDRTQDKIVLYTSTNGTTGYTSTTIATGSSIFSVGFAMNDAGIGGIAWHVNGDEDDTIYMQYTTDHGVTWEAKNYSTGKQFHTNNSIDVVIDAENNIWIAYMGANMAPTVNFSHYLIKFNGTTWSEEEIDDAFAGTTEGFGGSFSSPVLKLVDNKPFIAYFRHDTDALIRYAYRDNGGTGCAGTDEAHFTCVTVDTSLGPIGYTGGGNNGIPISIGVNGNDVVIAYPDISDDTIKVANGSPLPQPDNTATTLSCSPDPGDDDGGGIDNVFVQSVIISSFLINNGQTSTTSTLAALSILAPGASHMMFSFSEGFADAVWQAYEQFSSFFLGNTSGTKTIYAKVKNNIGVESNSASAWINLANVPVTTSTLTTPTITGSLFATSTQTSFAITTSIDATQMIVSESPSFTGASWETITTNKSWTLSTPDGVKTVYIKVRNAGFIESAVAFTTITLDTTPPTIPLILTPIQGQTITTSTILMDGLADTSASLELSFTSQNTELHRINPTRNAQNGVWSHTLTNITPGEYGLTAISKDAAQHESRKSITFTVENGPQIANPLIVNTPASAEWFTTTPIATSGTGKPGATIEIVYNNTSVASTKVETDGTWQTSVNFEKKDGPHTLTYSMYDSELVLVDQVIRSFFIGVPEVNTDDTTEDPGKEGSDLTGGSATTTDPNISSSTIPLETTDTTSTEKSIITEAFEAIVPDAVSEKISQVPEEIKKTISTAKKSFTTAAEKVRDVISTPSAQQINQYVAAPTVAAVATTIVAATTGIPQILLYLRFLFTQPLYLFTRRKRGWGVAYNAITHSPVDLAIVRILNQDGQVIQSRVTDKLGRYHFFAQPGTYTLDIQKPGFGFPLTYAQDGAKTTDAEVYFGGPLTILGASAVSYKVPLEPSGKVLSTKEILRLDAKNKMIRLISAGGIVFSGVSLIISPTILSIGFVALHATSYFIFRRLAHLAEPKTWATIRDKKTNKPLARTVIRLFSAQYKKLVESQVTGKDGRYGFTVGNGDYYLMVEKPGIPATTVGPFSINSREDFDALSKDIFLDTTPTEKS